MQQMSSNIHIPKTCQFCGKAFIARTTVTKYCGNSCAKKAYKKRKRDGDDDYASDDGGMFGGDGILIKGI